MSVDQHTPAPPIPPVLPPLDPTLPVPVAMITAGVKALAGMNPADLPPDTALLVAQALLVAHDQVKALALAAIADVERRQLYRLEDSPSTGTWIVEQATSFRRSDLALARKLDRIPHIAARIAHGAMSVDDGVLLGKALDRLRRHVDRPDGLIDDQPAEQALYGVIVNGICTLVGQSRGGLLDTDPRLHALRTELLAVHHAPLPQLPRLEQAFLILHRTIDPTHLNGALDQLVDALLPNTLDQDALDDEKNRRIELTKCQDRSGWDVGGHLDDETGELWNTLLTAAMATDPDNPLDTQTAQQLREQGLDPYTDGCIQVRTKGQRMHDALRLILRKTLASNALGVRGKTPVQINITVSSDTLHREPGALPATGSAGQTLPSSLVQRLACEGSAFTRFLTSLGGKVLEASHTKRTLASHERTIKRLETGGVCEGAGCNRGDPTGHPLIPHHITPYATCRTTSLDDTAMLCEISHTDLHHGKTIRLKNGRSINENGWVS